MRSRSLQKTFDERPRTIADQWPMVEFKDVTPLLHTKALAATLDFYVGILGFTVDTTWPSDEPGLCILDRGSVHLMFATDADWDTPGEDPCLTGQLTFDVTDAQAMFDSIRDKVPVLWGPEVYSYGRREFSIRDPNGYRLVFSEATRDPPTCED